MIKLLFLLFIWKNNLVHKVKKVKLCKKNVQINKKL